MESRGITQLPFLVLRSIYYGMIDKSVHNDTLAHPELRQMMHWNPDDFSEYGKTPNDNDYADPAFYRQDAVRTPNSAQPVPQVAPLDVHSDYAHGPTVGNSYDPALMSEYRGPANMDGYTTDAGAEQREAAERGGVESSSKRKGLAGLGGLGAILAALLKFQWLAVFFKFGVAGVKWCDAFWCALLLMCL